MVPLVLSPPSTTLTTSMPVIRAAKLTAVPPSDAAVIFKVSVVPVPPVTVEAATLASVPLTVKAILAPLSATESNVSMVTDVAFV